MFRLKKDKDNANTKNDKYTYASMRKLAFNYTPEQLGLKLENDDQVYGAVVDMGVGAGNTATMICFIDGTASLYFSNGGGIIGAGQHDSVKQVVTSFLVSSHQALPVMKRAENIDILPDENHHIVYLFTPAGVFTIDIAIEDIQNSKEAYFLFSLSQMVLSEIRKVSKKD